MKQQFIRTLIWSAVVCGIASTASAQSGGNFAISGATIDGGGGPSNGGNFSLDGTIGQPDAGAMSGGTFFLTGGFWPGLTDSGPRPVLSIRLGAANTILLIWPNPSTGYVLQQTANPSAPGGGWTDVAQPQPAIVGPNKEVTLPITGQSWMFRLRRP